MPKLDDLIGTATDLMDAGTFPKHMDIDFVSEVVARITAVYSQVAKKDKDWAIAAIDGMTADPDFFLMLVERFYECGYIQAVIDGKASA